MTKPILLFAFVLLAQDVQAGARARCAAVTRSHAKPLLNVFIGYDDERTVIDDEVKPLKPIKNPAGKGTLDVEEIWAGIYKGSYRMRFIYRHDGEGCVLVGQEIIEDTDL